MRNDDVARLLEDIAAALELTGGNAFRVRAYQDAARTIAYMSDDVYALFEKGQLERIPGVGPSIAEKIGGYLASGKSSYLEGLIHKIPSGAFELLEVPGIGPKRARQLFGELKVASLSELAEAARQHRIRDMPGMGARTEEAILKEVGRLTNRTRRLPLGVAWPLADRVARLLRSALGIAEVEPAGSIRRRRETIGDIDLLVGHPDGARVEKAIRALPITKEILAGGPAMIRFLTRDDFQVDVRVVPPENWGSALHHFTGSKAHNIALRDRANAMGYKVNEYGVFEEASGKRVGGRTEEEVYAILGLEWMPPELRENRGEIEAAERGELPRLITLDQVLGDFHSHTTASDGRASLEAMVEGAIARGYRFLVVTDHSFGLPVTRGLDVEKARAQWRRIQAMNERYAPFRIFRGVELEIRADGALDFDDAFLAEFDLVSASIHSGFKQPAERLTERMLGAIGNPHVDILNHPSGRLINRREAYGYHLDEVLRAAAAGHKAIEINGHPERMDLDDRAARRAKEAGVKLSLSTDAHAVGDFEAMKYAVAIARRAWLEPGDVINTLSPERLEAWARSHEKAKGARAKR